MSTFFKALDRALRARQGRVDPTSKPAAAAPPEIGNGADEHDMSLLTPAAFEVPQDRAAAQALSEMRHGVDEHLVSLLTPATFQAEQYRGLRHAVEHMHKAAGLQVIGVTSAAAGDGKTTTAINLAGALAQAVDARVLLVDADLRRSALGHRLGLRGESGPGLVSAIMDPTIGLAQLIQDRPPFNLSVIRAGQAPPSPYELLKSPRLGALLDEARGRFDYIIVDGPPLLPMQDSRVIGRWVDGFFLVVQAHRTPRPLVEEALNVVDPAKLIGVVFNGDDHPLSDYYSAAYASYAYTPEAPPNANGAGPCRRAVKYVKTMGATLWPGSRRR